MPKELIVQVSRYLSADTTLPDCRQADRDEDQSSTAR